MNLARRINRLVTTVTAARASLITSRRSVLVGRALVTFALLLLFTGPLQAQTVTLSWNANTESDLAGYIVYYGTASGVYSSNVDVGNTTTYTVGGLFAGQQYFFALKAYNTSGFQSPLSNEVSTAIGSSAQLTTPTPGSMLTGSTATFQWSAGTGATSYQLTVGTTVGGTDLFSQVVGTSLSATATGLPTNGSTVYVRLYSLVAGVWRFTDYTYAAQTNCSFTLGQTSASVGSTAATGTVSITATGSSCSSTATSNASWISVTGGSSGTGSRSVGYSVTANTGTSSRSGTLTIASQTFTVNQAGASTPSLTVSASTVNAGAPITVTVANAPGNPTDWMALASTSAPDTSYDSWKYLNNTTTVPAAGLTSATLTFTAPTTPGTYNFRFFANNTFTKLVTSSTVTVQGTTTSPTVAVSSTTVNPGAPITVTVANGPGNAMDWVTLASTSAADTSYLAWKFLNNTTTTPAALTSGTLMFTAPTTPGTYEFRFFANNTFTKLATSSTVTVAGQVSIAAVTVSATTVNPGSPITVTIANGPGNAMDWVTLASTSGADTSYVAWKFMNDSNFVPTTGVTSATLHFTAPTTPGTYNFRFFANNSFTKLATSSTVTVQAPPASNATVTVSATTVNPGSLITVTVAGGPGNQMDWVTLVSTGAADTSYVGWKFLNNTTTVPPSVGLTGGTLTFAAPTTPGTYNFRFFSNNTFTKLATSSTVTVQGLAPTVTVSSTTASRGALITVTVANGPANIADWVTMASASAPDTSYVTWEYLSGSTMLPTTGLRNATLQFRVPMTPGTYTFRFFPNNTFTKLATSATVTVQ